jgi:hypothetical protein
MRVCQGEALRGHAAFCATSCAGFLLRGVTVSMISRAPHVEKWRAVCHICPAISKRKYGPNSYLRADLIQSAAILRYGPRTASAAAKAVSAAPPQDGGIGSKSDQISSPGAQRAAGIAGWIAASQEPGAAAFGILHSIRSATPAIVHEVGQRQRTISRPAGSRAWLRGGTPPIAKKLFTPISRG